MRVLTLTAATKFLIDLATFTLCALSSAGLALLLTIFTHKVFILFWGWL